MKKYLFLLLLLLPWIGRAQITLNAADFVAPYTGADTLKATTISSVFPAMWPFAGAAWDMTVTTDSAPDIIMYRVPTSFGDYADSSLPLDFGSFLPTNRSVFSLNSVSFRRTGYHQIDYREGLLPITAVSTDTLYIPEQLSLHSTPITMLQFPATYGSTWSSSAVTNLNFEMTVGSLSMFHTPCVKRTYLSRRDSVRGWGSMRVRNAAGTPSDFIDVLQVNSTEITVDSFFIDGATSHPALLIAGMAQGQTDTNYTQYYYRKGELRPLATVAHKNGQYTQPERAWIHRQRLTTDVPEVHKALPVTVYPNPASSFVTIGLTAYSGAAICVISNVSGNTLSRQSIVFKDGTATLTLPANICTGAYQMQIETTDGLYTTQLVLVK